MKPDYVAIIAMLDRDLTHKISDVLKEKHGITKSTIVLARGDGEDDGEFLRMKLQPEQECCISLVESAKSEEVLLTIEEEGNLNKPGQRIAFPLDVKQIAGLI